MTSLAQNRTGDSCPKLEILTPPGGYYSRDERYILSVNAEGYIDTAEYEWEFSDGLKFTGQGKPHVYFIADDSLNGKTIIVRLKVIGFPEGCSNNATTKFEVHFNPGSPLIFDDFGDLKAREESERLGIVVEQLKRLPEARALFVIGYLTTDRKRDIRNRVNRIVSVLTGKFKLSNRAFTFVFDESTFRYTRIYAWPNDAPPNNYWISDIDKLNNRN
jgi:hypothetical protein